MKAQHKHFSFLAVSAALLMMILSSVGNTSCKREALGFQTDSLKDSTLHAVIAGDSVSAIYNASVESPVKGDAETVKWIRQWIALQMADVSDSVSATAGHVDSLYQKSKEAYHGDLSLSKPMLAWYASRLFNQFRKEAVKENIAMNYSTDVYLHVVYQTPALLTYQLSEYLYTGGAHGMPVSVYTNFDLKQRRSLLANDIFKKEATPKLQQMIVKGLCEFFEVPKKGKLSDFLFPEVSVTAPPLPQMVPGLTEDGVTLIYSSYEIACYAAGQPVVVLPYNKVWDCLTPYAQQLLGGTPPEPTKTAKH